MKEKTLTGYPSIDKPWLKYYDPDFLAQPLPSMNIYSYLKAAVEKDMARTAITHFGREVSYTELLEQIDSAAKAFVKTGVRAGERILFLMPNIPETAYLFYAAAKIGAVADFVDPRPDSMDFTVSAQKILAIVQDENIRHIVSLDQCYLSMLRPIEKDLLSCGISSALLVSAQDSMTGKAKLGYLQEKRQMEGLSGVLSAMKKSKQIGKLLESAKATAQIKLYDYKTFISAGSQEPLPDIPYAPNDLAVIVHTSGTTSTKPKPIPLTHDNLNIYAHQTFGANMPMLPGDRQLHILPYFAAFGIVDVAHACLCHRNNLIQVPEFAPNHLGKLIKRYKPQTIIGTPSWFLGLLQDPALKHADLSCLTMVTYGGDSMEAADEERINGFLAAHHARCKLTKGHGMSETCGCASYAIGEYNVPASIGIPMPLTTYGIVDSETKELLRFEDGEEYLEGELIISSGAVTPGVLDGRVIVPRGEYDGESYIFTRDIARMDRDGIMTFLARSDRSFTRFDGYKIKPYEVEAVIKDHPKVEHCVIIPLYDEARFGNLSVANIVPSTPVDSHDDQVALVREIIDDCFIHNPNVSSRQIPAFVVFYTEFPLTKNGKTNVNLLAENAKLQAAIQVIFEETNIAVGNITIQ